MIKIGYSTDALIIDTGAATLQLRSDFNPYLHRVQMDFTDDDSTLNGDTSNDEIGDDGTQSAVVTTMAGGAVASGQAYDEAYYRLVSGPSDVEVIEIGGVVVGYLTMNDLVPGVVYSIDSTIQTSGGGELGYSSYSDVACFGPGTLITTTDGDLPVEWLVPGDMVITRDFGAQPLRVIARTSPSYAELVANPIYWPVTIPANSIAPGQPNHPLVVTQQHRVLLTGGKVEFYFGHAEAFAAAGHLFHWQNCRAPQDKMSFFHLLFDDHQIILGNGLWTESLYLPDADDMIDASKFPTHIRHTYTARPCLRKWETAVLRIGSDTKPQRRQKAA